MLINLRRAFAHILSVFALCVSVWLLPPHAAQAGNIYDSNVENLLPLKGKQKSQVRAIVRQSDREMRKVFRKHGINPNARPVFDKLREAARELQAIEDREKAKMSKVLTKQQYKQYKGILNQTAARVRAAAQ